jgi:phosphohistidine phosphatase
MKTLYFLRHATAEVIRPGQLDIDRCLIEKGRLQARKVANFMLKYDLTPQLVLSSPYPRASQTAAIVSKVARLPQAEELDWLALETPTNQALTALQQASVTWPQQVLLVGHEPDFSALISALLGAEQPLLKVRKASLSCVSLQQDSACLQWSIPVRFMT